MNFQRLPFAFKVPAVHPVIRITAFLVAAAFLARAEPSVMLVVATGLVLALIRIPEAGWRTPLTLFRRLRWLLISLLLPAKFCGSRKTTAAGSDAGV